MPGVNRAHAQQVQKRVVAHPGPATKLPTEPAVAAGQDAIVALLYYPPGQGEPLHKSSYASRPVNGTVWGRHGLEGSCCNTADVSIAYDPLTRQFLAAAMANCGVAIWRFEPGPKIGEVIPGEWTQVDVQAGDGPTLVDKPWILAGEANPATGQEYYIVYGLAEKYYLRSTDAGETWRHGGVEVDGENITGGWGAQPAVQGDGPLYVACPSNSLDTIRFVRGADQPDGTVTFSWLLQSTDPDVPLTIPIREAVCYPRVPGGFSNDSIRLLPYLAADPSEPKNL
jgi:hypothetical protein